MKPASTRDGEFASFFRNVCKNKQVVQSPSIRGCVIILKQVQDDNYDTASQGRRKIEGTSTQKS